MIKKYRKKPQHLSSLESLMKRYPAELLPEYVQHEFQSYSAGWKGEKKLDRVMEAYAGSDWITLNDLKLQYDFETIQIDQLHITPNFILLMESKFYRGEVHFDHFLNQFYRISNGEKTPYKDPIQQIQRQVEGLSAFLRTHQFELPIIPLVVFTNEKVLLQSNQPSDYLEQTIVRLSQLSTRLRTINHEQRDRTLSHAKRKQLAGLLTRHHLKDEPFNLFRRYPSLDKKHIRRGVICPECHTGTLIKHYQQWKCTRCNHADTTSYLAAIDDYFNLYSKAMTSKDGKEFLFLKPNQKFCRIIKNAPCLTKGKFKATKYVPKSMKLYHP